MVITDKNKLDDKPNAPELIGWLQPGTLIYQKNLHTLPETVHSDSYMIHFCQEGLVNVPVYVFTVYEGLSWVVKTIVIPI